MLAAQAAAFPPQVEEAYDDDEPFDVETESEVETEETEGLADDAAEAVAGESEADGHRRKRRRRRRGRGEPRDGAAPREDGDVVPVAGEAVASEAVEGAAAEDGEADEDEGDEQPGVARGDQPAGGERRPRRRGRRGGRRRRGTELEDGLAGSIADELGPTSASEATSAVADFDGAASEPAPSLVQADVQPDPVSQPEPVSQPAEMQPAAYARPEPVEERAPAPSAEETSQEAERAAARRRSTVREKVSFVTSAPAEPAPSVSHSVSEPIESPASAPTEPAPATSGDDAPRKAGWWSRRFGSGE